MKLLSHYSREPVQAFSVDFPVRGDNAHKPGGLWLSDDSEYGWRAFVMDRVAEGCSGWADGEELFNYRYDFEIVEHEDGQVLYLESSSELYEFARSYGELGFRECVVDDTLGYGLHIGWDQVKADYMGILIAPFHPSLSRKEPYFHWYRFDCASGCFWDMSCLRSCSSTY